MKERDVTAEDRLAVLFQPDTLLPVQYFDRLRRRTEYNGERRLLIAVLEDAVDVYRKQVGAHDPRSKALFHDAEAWIEDLDCTWLFSFQNICDVLDLDAEYIRRGLRALKAQILASRHLPMVALQTNDSEESGLRRASGASS
jgi:hypothetical protein